MIGRLLFSGWVSVVVIASAQIEPPSLPTNARTFDFYRRAPYRPELLRPEAVLGYEPGRFHTTYAQFEALLREYSQISKRLKVLTIGRTAEQRSMYLLAVSAPQNLDRLEAIKSDMARLADPRQAKAGPEIDQIVKTSPVVVWLTYSIHGNESAAFEAGIQVLYELLASDSIEIQRLLENCVVLINPCQNPDGHERFATWYNAMGMGRPERFAYEHREPWSIYGRLNHYFFDLNRDLISISQAESLAATRAFLEWHPQVLADHHGQTSEYFFPPPSLPINPNLPRKPTDRWLEIFGQANARAFDQFSWNYYVRDVFDLFYPGYWDSWSTLHGAIGMTYETDGGGTRGYRWYRDDRTILTLRDGIAKHFTASLATLATAADHREARLRDFRTFFEESLSSLKRKYFLMPADESVFGLVRLLRNHGVEVGRLNAEMRLSKVRDYLGNEISNRTIPAGAFVVDTAQPYGRMANALLEPETPSDPEFIKRQEQKRKINDAKGSEEARDDYDFFDATAWSLPFAMGVEAFYADETPRLETSNIELAEYPILRTRTPNGELKEDSLPTVPEARTAYLFDGGSQSGARLAFALLQRGYRLATSNSAFRAEGKDFARGTIIVRVERNPADLHPVISELGRRCGVPLIPISSAFIDQGFEGIGSESVYALRPPKVAVLAGDPVSQTSFGLLRFLLEQIYGLEFVPIAADAITNAPLDDFNVLILPSGEETRYERYLGDKETKRLKEWVSEGGVLIAVGEASEFAVSAKLTASRILGAEAKEDEKGGKPKEPKPGSDERKPTAVPGALIRATINRDHFLSIGCKTDFVPVLVQGDTFYKPTETGANVLTFSAEKLKLSGFVWPNDTEELLRGTVALIDEPLGSGRVILFSDEPGKRLVWMTTTLFLRNAILFGPSQPRKEKQW